MNWFRLAQPVILAWGWRRALIAFLAGAASTLALAPFNAWPVMFATFPLLVWLIDGAATKRWNGAGAGFAIGWCFGFGYFLAGLYWIGYAFLVDAKTFGWLLPFAVTALPAGLALFTAFGVALARLSWSAGPFRIMTLAAALAASEWLRGHALTGFPWDVFGYALTTPLRLAQSVSLFGVWGLTFIAVAVFASPATLADRYRWRCRAGARRRRYPRCACRLMGRRGWRSIRRPSCRGQAADRATQPGAGREVQLRRPPADPQPLHRAL